MSTRRQSQTGKSDGRRLWESFNVTKESSLPESTSTLTRTAKVAIKTLKAVAVKLRSGGEQQQQQQQQQVSMREVHRRPRSNQRSQKPVSGDMGGPPKPRRSKSHRGRTETAERGRKVERERAQLLPRAEQAHAHHHLDKTWLPVTSSPKTTGTNQTCAAPSRQNCFQSSPCRPDSTHTTATPVPVAKTSLEDDTKALMDALKEMDPSSKDVSEEIVSRLADIKRLLSAAAGCLDAVETFMHLLRDREAGREQNSLYFEEDDDLEFTPLTLLKALAALNGSTEMLKATRHYLHLPEDQTKTRSR